MSILNSTLNSRSASTLLQGATFQGSFELCEQILQIVIIVNATVSGTDIGLLTVEFANSAADPVTLSVRMPIFSSDFSKIIVCKRFNKYFRVKFTAVDIYDTRSPNQANDFVALSITTQLRTIVGYNDINMSEHPVVLRGLATPAVSFGAILGTNVTQVSMATYTVPQAPCALRVTNTSGSNNDESGTAARTFLVTGVNATFDEIYWVGAFVGSGTSTSSPAVFLAVNDFRPLTFGSGGSIQSGSTISLQINNASWQTLGELSALSGYTFCPGIYTVPNGYAVTPVLANVSTTFRSYNMRLGVVPFNTRTMSQSTQLILGGTQTLNIKDFMAAAVAGSMLVLDVKSSATTNTLAATVFMKRGTSA